MKLFLKLALFISLLPKAPCNPDVLLATIFIEQIFVGCSLFHSNGEITSYVCVLPIQSVLSAVPFMRGIEQTNSCASMSMFMGPFIVVTAHDCRCSLCPAVDSRVNYLNKLCCSFLSTNLNNHFVNFRH